MPPKKLAALLFTACFCAGSVTLVILKVRSVQGGSQGRLNTKAPVFALTTREELVLMRGDRVLTRVPRLFVESDPAQNKVVWTYSGDYLALLSHPSLREEDVATQELVFIDAHSGKVGRIPCPRCWELAAVEKNGILV